MIMLYCLILGTFTRLGTVTGLRIGVFMALPMVVSIVLFRRLQTVIKRWPFAALVVVNALFYTLVLLGALWLITLQIHPNESKEHLGLYYIATHIAWWLFPVFYCDILIVIAARGIARKLGPGVFLNWIRGYYHRPRIEDRIIMFLDMRDSTSLAEQLGDERFSALLRDFMIDLSDPVEGTRGEISHYIGDEAVITWRTPVGLKDARPLQCFFWFEEKLRQRRGHYLATYGLVPGFKAGLHVGRVVATEVGEIKSEIVFHGDVLNTTARIQAACKSFGASLLCSEELAGKFDHPSWCEFTPLGPALLKGKAEPIDIVRISLAPHIRLPEDRTAELHAPEPTSALTDA